MVGLAFDNVSAVLISATKQGPERGRQGGVVSNRRVSFEPRPKGSGGGAAWMLAEEWSRQGA